jgi:hypothetical protein
MLKRPDPSPAARRARDRRARQRTGIERDLKLRVPTRRLRAAMQAANPDAGMLDTREALEAELAAVIDAWIVRWLGPARK